MPGKKEEMGLCTGREDQGTTISLGKMSLQDYQICTEDISGVLDTDKVG